MPGFLTFLAPIGVVHLILGTAGLAIFPMPLGTEATTLAVAVGSSVLRVAAVLLMLGTMRTEEVSRVIPVTHTFPIFVAILAVPLLGEDLSGLDWLAIMMTVSGAVSISVRWDSTGKRLSLSRSFALLMLSSILFGVANIGSKYAMEQISFWNMYAVNAACLGAVSLMISLRPRTLRNLRDMPGRELALGLILFNECLSVIGFALSFWAIDEGPVSLVSTILSTRPAFIFIYVVGLSRFFPAVLGERLSRGIVAAKVASIGLIIGGVALLTTAG